MPRRREAYGVLSAVCVGVYSDEDQEFLLAMERWKHLTGRRYPTCTEVLAVAKSLGYRKVAVLPEQNADGNER